MEYLKKEASIENVRKHLRNKNLGLMYPGCGLLKSVKNRLDKLYNAYLERRCPPRLVVSEQVVENTLLLRNLRDTDVSILDFGGVESNMPLQLTAMGHKVTVWDQRDYPFQHPNLKVIHADILADNPGIRETFDVVMSISTIEHVGLGAYGDIAAKDADRKAVSVLWSLVKEGGRLIVTVPAGKPAIQRGYQVYDAARIKEVFPDNSKTRWFMKESRYGVWSEVTAEAIANKVYDEPEATMPVDAVAVVVCEKDSRKK